MEEFVVALCPLMCPIRPLLAQAHILRSNAPIVEMAESRTPTLVGLSAQFVVSLWHPASIACNLPVFYGSPLSIGCFVVLQMAPRLFVPGEVEETSWLELLQEQIAANVFLVLHFLAWSSRRLLATAALHLLSA